MKSIVIVIVVGVVYAMADIAATRPEDPAMRTQPDDDNDDFTNQFHRSDLADLTNAIEDNAQIAVEINSHPMPAKSLDNVISRSSDRIQCQDSPQYASNCPGWTWACTNSMYVSFMQSNCKESCGLCSDPGQCQDSTQYASNCPGWTWACTDYRYISFMQANCQKSCGLCSTGGGSGQACAKIPTWMRNAINFNGKIVNGMIAQTPIPWQVQVRGSSFCGGTILDEYTILSAAHCEITSNSYIVAGTKSLQSGPQTIYVKNAINHPQYNPVTVDNDISIVKLTSALSFNTNVKPACLPTANFFPGGVAVASGWGSITNYNGYITSRLRYTGLPITQCHSGSTSNMVCAGGNAGKGICAGDSGGPLVVPKSTSDFTAVVIGITSHVFGDCALGNNPDVYASVTAQLNWIKATSGIA